MKCVVELAFDPRASTHEQLQGLHFRTIECRIEHLGHHTIRQGEPHLRSERSGSSKAILRRGGPTSILPHAGGTNNRNQQKNPCHPRHLWLKILYPHASNDSAGKPAGPPLTSTNFPAFETSTDPKNGRLEKLIATKTSSPAA